jgi:hypothetical protein
MVFDRIKREIRERSSTEDDDPKVRVSKGKRRKD